ncbi:MAG TPA: outer membrane beta-barrel protein [Pedobacter sp.]|uniref:outer membrane beta-barrel protein n=1 Tax=Pedobacter sp. TaxID=1411316 RepID=UPI002C640A7C|nr:outer membrane beta-barrel protein [Pedobacter sp.]HMI02361.1 outer membrane beta-barrel protein [Pedobacter sp.]
MKKQLLTALAVVASLCGYAQTKGTNALSLGVSTYTSKSEQNIPSGNARQKQKQSSFSLGYGHFISDNTKLGIDLLYGRSSSTSTNNTQNNATEIFGGGLSYQKYYPLIGKFYAYAGGSASYSLTKLDYDDLQNLNSFKSNSYGLGAYGGVTWFINKRWALETRLLSATASYTTTNQTDGTSASDVYKKRDTNFSLNTQGIINDLGFKIYLLF